MKGWLETFAGPFYAALPEGERQAARDETLDLLRHSLCDSEGNWTADYVRLRFAARLSGLPGFALSFPKAQTGATMKQGNVLAVDFARPLSDDPNLSPRYYSDPTVLLLERERIFYHS